MASDPDRLSMDATRDASPECGRGCGPADFRQRIAAMPRLLDDSDLEEFRRMGIPVEGIRRARRQYLRELLRDLERETARLAGDMAQAPQADLGEIFEFRRGVRGHARRLRILALLHAFGVQVDAASRKRSAALSAVMLAAER